MPPIRVLVADSQLLFADALAGVLARASGLRVVAARPTTGADAVEAATVEDPDVAVLDYWLHDMDGPAVIRALLLQRPDLRVVNLSGPHTPHDIEAALNAGAVAFLTKGTPVARIADATRRAHAGEDPVFAEELGELADRIRAGRAYRHELDRRLASLTARELDVLRLAAQGLSQQQIAGELHLAESTVETYTTRILSKLGVRSKVEAVAAARMGGAAP